MTYPFGAESAGYGTTWIRNVIEGLSGKKVFGEFAFVNPDFPEGILARRLRELTVAQQQAALRYWFMLNYLPAEAAQQGMVSPIDALNAVFDTRVDPAIRTTLAAELNDVSALWQPTFTQPDLETDVGATTSAALHALKAAAEQLQSHSRNFGHNSASTLITPDNVREITAAAEQGLAAVSAGKLGEASGRDVRRKIAGWSGNIGALFAGGVVAGLGKDLADDTYKSFMLVWLQFLHAMVHALSSMDSWLAWISALKL